MTLPPSPPPPFTAVAVLAREYPVLEPATLVISAFLERSTELSLEHTCAYGSLTLLDRMWATSPATTADADLAAANGEAWSLRWFLRSDRDYNHHQFEEAMARAAVRGDLRMVQWLFDHFSGCVVRAHTVENVICEGHLEILQYWWAAGRPILPSSEEGSSEIPEEANEVQGTSRRHDVNWRDFVMTKFTYKRLKDATIHHADVVWWLVRTVRREWNFDLAKYAIRYGEIPQVQWMLENGFPDKAETQVTEGRLEALQWLVDQGFRSNTSYLLDRVASTGHLELVQWIAHRYPTVQSSSALKAACEKGHSAVAHFLVENGMCERGVDALTGAIEGGDMELIEYVRSHGFRISCRFRALGIASRKGRLDLVQWILEHFSDGTWEDEGNYSIVSEYPMNEAAANGHLEVLEFLHGIDSMPIVEWACRRNHYVSLQSNVMCSTKAMDEAACNGHLEVVKWLHENRSEGCDLAFRKAFFSGHMHVVEWMLDHRKGDCCFRNDVNDYPYINVDCYLGTQLEDPFLDNAAARGRLDVIQWLKSRGQLKGSTIAMAHAAGSGRLDVMKWLHKNRLEGSGTYAMDYAAQNGQLAALRWLHENQVGGCSTKAMDDAARKNFFDVVLFLHSHRTEGSDADLDYLIKYHPHVARWIYRNYPRP